MSGDSEELSDNQFNDADSEDNIEDGVNALYDLLEGLDNGLDELIRDPFSASGFRDNLFGAGNLEENIVIENDNFEENIVIEYGNFEENIVIENAPPIQPRVAPLVARRVLDDVTKQRLQQQRIDNERPSALFSRSCGICYSVNPLLRAVYTRCGHIVCLPCAEEQSYEGKNCPFCRAEGTYIRLHEDEKEIEAASENKE